MDIDERFWSKVKLEDQVFPENGCMLWTGGRTGGRLVPAFYDGIKKGSAVRWIYQRLRGPIPSDLVVHHCRNRDCVNPDHVELITHKIKCERRLPRDAKFKKDIDERFWSHVQLEDESFPENGCMKWTSTKNPDGYAMFGAEGKTTSAGRWLYNRLHGPIPDGLELDHLCRVKACVNPDHLEPVTRLENVRRGDVMLRNTHCRKGHPFSIDNTYVHQLTGGRACRICKRETQRAYRKKRREEGKYGMA